jgi:uncharacterized protein (DUF433 family)
MKFNGFGCLFKSNCDLSMKYVDIITIQSEKRFGKPCVRNTRISVYDVLSWLASGMAMQEILEDLPELTHEDILACLAFAAEKEHLIKIAI